MVHFLCILVGVIPDKLECIRGVTTLDISWSQPDPLGEVEKYVVTRTGTTGHEVFIHNDTTNMFYNFTELTPFTNYTIYVQTVNKKGPDGGGGTSASAAKLECTTKAKRKSVSFIDQSNYRPFCELGFLHCIGNTITSH